MLFSSAAIVRPSADDERTNSVISAKPTRNRATQIRTVNCRCLQVEYSALNLDCCFVCFNVGLLSLSCQISAKPSFFSAPACSGWPTRKNLAVVFSSRSADYYWYHCSLCNGKYVIELIVHLIFLPVVLVCITIKRPVFVSV